jgi:Mrp family chromosome partitioning ATPase
MSRNFELMQQIEGDALLRSQKPTGSKASSQAESVCKSNLWANDEVSSLIQRVFRLHTQDSPRMVVFAGIDHGDGCSWISASVADSLARTALRPVCLVEANFRTPTLPNLFGTTNHYGLTDSLLAEDPISSYVKPVGAGKLWLLSSGGLAWDSANTFSSERVKARMAELRTEFEFVIIDAPPLSRYADAVAIGQLTDGLVVVLKAGSTRREAAQAAVSNLRLSKVPILGSVLNKRTYPIPESIYKRL